MNRIKWWVFVLAVTYYLYKDLKKHDYTLKFCFCYAQNFDNYFEDIDISNGSIFEYTKWSVQEDFSYWEGE